MKYPLKFIVVRIGGSKMGRKIGKALSAVVGTPNWKNRTVFVEDNIYVLRGMNSDCVDLVYLDPPFNSNRAYEAPIGSKAAGASFKDAWTLSDVDDEWLGLIAEKYPAVYSVCQSAQLSHGKGMKSYLVFMSVRIMELHRVLKPSGSIFLHVDPTASHYLKLVMDAIFGKENFRNEIVWGYRGGGVPKNAFARKHDVILFYAKDKGSVFNKQYVPYSEASMNLVSSRGGKSIDGKKRDLKRGASMPDYWTDINSLQTWSPERTGYPTQKPLLLLERFINTGSDEGQVVLDPFCGCATACVAAEKLGRQWVGIDISPKAYDVVRQRLEKVADEGALFKGGEIPDVIVRSDIPVRSDLSEPLEYNTLKHKLFGLQEGFCNGCGHDFPFRNFHVDHIVAKDKGGGDNEENLQLLCGACNSMKGTGTQEELMAKLRKEGIIS